MKTIGPALTLIATDVESGDEVGALRRRIVDLHDLLTLIEAGGRADSGIRTLLRDCLDDCRRRLGDLDRCRSV